MRIPIGLCATNTEVASLRWVADTFPSLDLHPPRLHRTPRLRPSTRFRRQSRPSQRLPTSTPTASGRTRYRQGCTTISIIHGNTGASRAASAVAMSGGWQAAARDASGSVLPTLVVIWEVGGFRRRWNLKSVKRPQLD